MNAEQLRLIAAARREQHWRRWGPYLAERAWGTVREDYSPDGSAWEYFPLEDSHLRAYGGVRMALPRFPITSSVCASRWHSGMSAILSSKSVSTASVATRVITAKT